MKTIVIGDIHGCYNELKELVSYLESEKVYDKNNDKLIFLGDYIDRGENSRGVIRYVRKLQEENNNVIALMGNHEDMAVSYFDGDPFSSWTINGYEHTLRSYIGHTDEFESDLEWMRNLPLYHEDENFIYVHAGVNLNKDIAKQDRDTLLWIRDEFIYNTKDYYKRVVFGHSPSIDKPYYTMNNSICIDTGCVFGGSLTALVIEDGKERKIYNVKKGEKAMNNINDIRVLAQAFYGNRTIVDIDIDDIDRFVLGYLDDSLKITKNIDRTIIRVPDSDDIVFIYNKYQEEEKRNNENKNPTVIIPENNITLYSRCIACRMDENGDFYSLDESDCDTVFKYFVA